MDVEVIHGILLAAGQSRRFGSDKLIYPLPDGIPVAVAALRPLLQSVSRVVAVVRPNAARLSALLHAEGAVVVTCPRAHAGMGASLAWGVAATAQATGWIVALADMPFIQPATCQQVATALQRGALLAAPVYRGQRGHPVGFADRLGAALRGLTGDQGARDVLSAHKDQLRLIETDDAGVIHDIDVAADISSHR